MSDVETTALNEGGLRAMITVYRLLAPGEKPGLERVTSSELGLRGINSLHLAIEGAALCAKVRKHDDYAELLIDEKR